MATTYAQMQEQIRLRLDQRTDLGQIIYDFSQTRIAYWSKFFFYASDTTDTSLSTQPFTVYYPLPGGMRNVRMVRLLLGSNQGQQSGPPTTTTTAAISLPQAVIPVASTTGFNSVGALFIGSQVIGYTGLTATTFTGCGLASLFSGNTGITSGVGAYASGTSVSQAAGVWLELRRTGMNGIYDVLSDDVVQPPNQSIPAAWAQFGTQIRLYPVAGSVFRLELTGNASPPAPVNDDDDNFWTEPADAGSLIVNSTVAHIFANYLGAPDRAAPFFAEEQKHLYALKKITFDLGGAKIFRAYGPGYTDRGRDW